MFEDIPTIKAKNEFVTQTAHALRRDVDLTDPDNKQALAKNIFMFGQCMEGTQFYGLFGMILSLYRQNKFPGIGQMFRYTLRDESNHIELFRNLLMDLVERKPGNLDRRSSGGTSATLMGEAVGLEKEFIRDCLPVSPRRPERRGVRQYIDYIADRRLEGVRPETAASRSAESVPLARRNDGHQEGSKLLRAAGHRIPEGLRPRRGR